MLLRRRSQEMTSDPAINANRTDELYGLTSEGYIIAQDIACQHELIAVLECDNCGGKLLPIAQINRAFQGLNEVVALCEECSQHHSLIFDISNEVYQSWWAERMGENYVQIYDGPPRIPIME
jgi:hypothetical protein